MDNVASQIWQRNAFTVETFYAEGNEMIFVLQDPMHEGPSEEENFNRRVIHHTVEYYKKKEQRKEIKP